MRPAMGLDFGLGQFHPVQHQHGLDGLAQNRVGYAHDGGFHHAFQRVKHVLDFFGGNLFSPALNDVVLARHKIQVTLVIHPK